MEKNAYPSACEPAYFSLNRLKAHCYFPPVTVDFSPPLYLFFRLSPQGKVGSAFPVFNQDLRHFTPAFLLSS